jgi:chromosome segregation ATPase
MDTRDNPLRDREDYLAKRKALQDIQLDPHTHKDPELTAELIRKVALLKKQAREMGLEEADHSFDFDNLNAGSRKLLVHVRSKYPWAKTDLEALLAYIKDEDSSLEKEITDLEGNDRVQDTDIDSLDSELDHEQRDVDSHEARISKLEQRVKEIADRIFTGVERR